MIKGSSGACYSACLLHIHISVKISINRMLTSYVTVNPEFRKGFRKDNQHADAESI